MGGSVGLIIGSSDGGSGDDFFNGFAPVGFKLTAWADGFLVPWLWLLMASVLLEVDGEGE